MIANEENRYKWTAGTKRYQKCINCNPNLHSLDRIIYEFAQTKKHKSPLHLLQNLIKMKFSLIALAAVVASAEAISKPSLSVSPARHKSIETCF